MTTYDHLSLISEKQNIVIDIGWKYTKFGFSGEACPRCIIPTGITRIDTGKFRPLFSYDNNEEFRANVVDFIRELFYNYGIINPKDKKVAIVESLLGTSIIRDTLARVLFVHYEVSSLVFVPCHMSSLYPLAIDTALVVDLGYREATVIPIYAGFPILKAWQAVPLSSQAVENRLRTHLKEKAKLRNVEESVMRDSEEIFLSDDVIEDIKVKGCFVTTLERAQLFGKGETPEQTPLPFTYAVEGDTVVTVGSDARELSYEVMFELDQDIQSLPAAILESVLRCPIDARTCLSENIVLVGGTAMVDGLISRVKSELTYLANNVDRFAKNACPKRFKFHKIPVKQNYMAWLGGSIYASTDALLTTSVSREAYFEGNYRIPDWPCLTNNALRREAI